MIVAGGRAVQPLEAEQKNQGKNQGQWQASRQGVPRESLRCLPIYRLIRRLQVPYSFTLSCPSSPQLRHFQFAGPELWMKKPTEGTFRHPTPQFQSTSAANLILASSQAESRGGGSPDSRQRPLPPGCTDRILGSAWGGEKACAVVSEDAFPCGGFGIFAPCRTQGPRGTGQAQAPGQQLGSPLPSSAAPSRAPSPQCTCFPGTTAGEAWQRARRPRARSWRPPRACSCPRPRRRASSPAAGVAGAEEAERWRRRPSGRGPAGRGRPEACG